MSVRCAVVPGPVAPAVAAAVADGGGRLVDPDQAEALIWTDAADAVGLRRLLAGNAGIRWVQLPFAGVDRFLGLFDDGRTWTGTRGRTASRWPSTPSPSPWPACASPPGAPGRGFGATRPACG